MTDFQKKRGFVKFKSKKLLYLTEFFTSFSGRTFAIRFRDGFLNIGYGYNKLAVPVYLTSNKFFQAINIYTK